MTTRERRDGGGRERRERREDQSGGFQERVVAIKRVAKVVKGGKNFSFNALVVIGDGAGQVGIGLGKAGEVPDAVRKGTTVARRTLIRVPMVGSTIPHEVNMKYGGAEILLRPAAPGSGVIAGGSIRAVVAAVGIRDILTKSLGSSNPINVVKATYMALESLRIPADAVRLRKELAVALAASPPPEPRSPRPPRPTPRAPRADRPAEAAAAPVAAEIAAPAPTPAPVEAPNA